ncbi:VQ motif-containing protein 10-like [Carica papaya]|uniref:VQ motif-containing protein 10-like n=1 Tax=Carica papaya TaxID=3649 RepID=UPI000B8CCDDB|nr:VQ motif-containing protein 10-like [Carica papaya]
MGRAGSGDKKVMKVVIINTEYVETDATSFKSVVQRLTGKEAEVATVPPIGSRRKLQGAFGGHQGTMKREEEESGSGGLEFMRNCSFKDLDRLLKEIPTVDELLWGSWTDNY